MRVDIKAVLDQAGEILNRTHKAGLTAHAKLHFKIVSDNPDILGRGEDATALQHLFAEGPHPVVIHGPGGIGKTAFADHFARSDFRSPNPRYCGAWRVSAESITEAARDIKPLSAHLGVEDQGDEETNFHATMARMAETRGKKRWLLIHDNADNPREQRYLARRFQFPEAIDHLVTSRISQWRPPIRTFELEEPGVASAVALLRRESGLSLDTSLFDLAVNVLERWPLALMVVGADLRKTGASPEEYEQRFRDIVAHVPPDYTSYERTVAAAVLESYSHLGSDAQALMHLAAFMAPDDVDPDYLVKGMSRLEEGTLWHGLANDKLRRQAAFSEIGNQSLLRPTRIVAWSDEHDAEVETESLKMHRLAQLALRDMLTAEERANAIGAAGRLGQAQISDNPQHDIHPRYSRLVTQARALSPHAAGANDTDLKPIASFLNEITIFVQFSSGELHEMEKLRRDIIPIVEKGFGKDSVDHATAQGNLGVVLGGIGLSEPDRELAKQIDEEAEALLKHSIDLKRDILGTDSFALAADQNNLAVYCWQRKRYEEAEPLYLDVARIMEASDEPSSLDNLGTLYGNIGTLYSNWAFSLGKDHETYSSRREDAMDFLHKALATIRGRHGELSQTTATALNNLAGEYEIGGEIDRGIRLRIRGGAIMERLRGIGAIKMSHPLYGPYVTNFAQKFSNAEDVLKAMATDINNAIADHTAWQNGGTPNWPT